jgi:hypothetical protein
MKSIFGFRLRFFAKGMGLMSESTIQTVERKESSAQHSIRLSPCFLPVTPRNPNATFTPGVIGDLPEIPQSPTGVKEQREMGESFGMWSLLHDPRVMLTVGSAAQDTASRFVELFRATWSRLPTEVQKALAQTWKSSDDGFPNFFLVYDLDDHAPGVGTYAIHSGQARFDFSAIKLRDLPNGLAEALIAHELAHCFLRHAGDYSTDHEDEADAVVESWGFPMGELRTLIRPQNET